jgi:hypothetical protein
MTGIAVSTMITANSDAFDNDFERHIVESSQTGKNISIHRPNWEQLNSVNLIIDSYFLGLTRATYDHLSIKSVIGKGAFSVVLKAKWNYSYVFPKRDVAVKVTNVKNEKQFMQDVGIKLLFYYLFNSIVDKEYGTVKRSECYPTVRLRYRSKWTIFHVTRTDGQWKFE